MRERATVVALGDGGVWVETQRRGSCGSCSSRISCGGSMMERFMPGRANYIRALVEPDQRAVLAVGDSVELQVPDQVVLRASVVLYLLPLGLFMLGMCGGSLLVPGDPGAILGGLLGLALGFAAVRVHAGLTRDDSRLQPRLVLDSSTAQGADAIDKAGSCGRDSIRVLE